MLQYDGLGASLPADVDDRLASHSVTPGRQLGSIPTSTASSRRAAHDEGALAVIIGLAGGTGSGKSSIVRGLVARIGGCVIDLDEFLECRDGELVAFHGV